MMHVAWPEIDPCLEGWEIDGRVLLAYTLIQIQEQLGAKGGEASKRVNEAIFVEINREVFRKAKSFV